MVVSLTGPTLKFLLFISIPTVITNLLMITLRYSKISGKFLKASSPMSFCPVQYLMLLRSMASALEMDDVSGLRSMAHIPKDERARLAGQREQAVELLASRIKVLKERITRKDELLQGYERDLARLRYCYRCFIISLYL